MVRPLSIDDPSSTELTLSGAAKATRGGDGGEQRLTCSDVKKLKIRSTMKQTHIETSRLSRKLTTSSPM